MFLKYRTRQLEWRGAQLGNGVWQQLLLQLEMRPLLSLDRGLEERDRERERERERQRERERYGEKDDAIAKSRFMMMPCPPSCERLSFEGAGENRSNVKYPPELRPPPPDNGGPIIGFLRALET